MAREIVALCDVHLSRDERVPGREYRVGVAGRWVSLDLCDGCHEEVLRPFVALVEDFGAPVEPVAQAQSRVRAAGSSAARLEASLSVGTRMGKAPAGERNKPCLWCALDYAGGSGLLRHLRTIHGFASADEAYGQTCPVCGRECGGARGLGLHVRRSHQFGSLAEAFVWARDNADPYGVCATVLAGAQGRVPLEEDGRPRS